MEDEEEILTVGDKRSHIDDLQDHNLSFDQAVKRDRHNSMESTFIDR